MDTAVKQTAVRVFLVEDTPEVLERLQAMLGSIPGAQLIGSAAGPDEAIRKILATRPDIVVLDLRLADGKNGFGVLRAVRAQAPEVDVYLLSNYALPAYREAALRLGACDFFDKTADFNRVREIVAARANAAAH
jgi:DNA-binding NarL/FixJ family response regulator